MFDTAKVQRMTTELIKFAREHAEIYVIPEWLTPDAFALFRRMRITVRAIIINQPLAQKEIFGCPVMVMAEAIKNFTARTGIIHLSAKPQPMPVNMAIFTIGNHQLNVPLFAISMNEALAIYDRLTLMRVLQQYQEDGLPIPPLQDLSIRFARGVTTFLNPDTESIKIQLWDRNYFKAPQYDIDDTAIVLRGQVVYENRYTEKTIEFYRATYPNAPIIVSTWKNELTDEFRTACKKNSVVLLENIHPAMPGLGHTNYQLENAFRGVDYVKNQLGSTYVLVTRTDQRLNKFDFLLHFRNLIQTFPPLGDKLQGRIITLGAYLTTRYLPFSITDFLVFGFTTDIAKYYYSPRPEGFGYSGIPLPRYDHIYRMREKILRPIGFKKIDLAKCRRKLKKFNLMLAPFYKPISLLQVDFYQRYIAPIDKTTLLENWWKFFREYWLLVDVETVIFDWIKYEDRCRYTVILEGTRFSQWLELYRNFNVDWV